MKDLQETSEKVEVARKSQITSGSLEGTKKKKTCVCCEEQAVEMAVCTTLTSDK